MQIKLKNEITYSFNSTDNVRSYNKEIKLNADHISSVHGIIIDTEPSIVIGAGGGASGVHSDSFIILDNFMYLAIGDCICKIDLNVKDLVWSLKIDTATCFGVHYSQKHNALISHGELEIARFSEDGEILWSSSGKDIFSEGFCLKENFIEAVDFESSVYHINYKSGEIVIKTA